MQNYSRVQSCAIVNHACEVAIKRGERQTDICAAIDVDAGYFSKCKSGKKFLSLDKLTSLIDEYGKPSFLQSGVYKLSERYSSVEEFTDGFRDGHELYLANQQLGYWKREEFQKNMTLMLNLKDAHLEQGANKYQRLTEILKELLSLEEFREWFDLYHPSHDISSISELLGGSPKAPDYPTLQSILDYFNITVNEAPGLQIEAFFQRLGMMHFLFESIENFAFENTKIKKIPVSEEFIIQGNCIFEDEGRLNDKLAKRTEKFVTDYSANSFRFIESSLDFRMIDCDSVLTLYGYILEVFMTDNLNFYACLALKYTDDTLNRNMIIPLDASDIVDNLKKILKTIGAKSLHSDLAFKKALAEEGATIPGVTLLD